MSKRAASKPSAKAPAKKAASKKAKKTAKRRAKKPAAKARTPRPKRRNPAAAPAVETQVIDVVEEVAPGVVAVTEIETVHVALPDSDEEPD